MVNPGTFRGLRKEFLLGEKATYSEAVTGGYAADALANIQRRYFKRFPPELPPQSLAVACILVFAKTIATALQVVRSAEYENCWW